MVQLEAALPPEAVLYVPASQFPHVAAELEPITVENLPGSHMVQLEAASPPEAVL
jgi:hypothetical protein